MHIERLIINNIYMYNNNNSIALLALWLYLNWNHNSCKQYKSAIYEGCSKMNASSFITFDTYML